MLRRKCKGVPREEKAKPDPGPEEQEVHLPGPSTAGADEQVRGRGHWGDPWTIVQEDTGVRRTRVSRHRWFRTSE